MASEAQQQFLDAAQQWYDEQQERPYDSAPKAQALFDEIQELFGHCHAASEPYVEDIDRLLNRAHAWLDRQKTAPSPQSLGWSPGATSLYHAMKKLDNNSDSRNDG